MTTIKVSGNMAWSEMSTMPLALVYMNVLKEGDSITLEEKVYKKLNKHVYYIAFHCAGPYGRVHQIKLEQGKMPEVVLGDIE